MLTGWWIVSGNYKCSFCVELNKKAEKKTGLSEENKGRITKVFLSIALPIKLNKSALISIIRFKNFNFTCYSWAMHFDAHI